MRVVRDLSVPDADSLSPVRVFPCVQRVKVQTEVPPGDIRLWALARYAATKRLNEHLRTPRQFRVNRTWLILSRKICGGRLPRARADSYFSSPVYFSRLSSLFIIPRQTRARRTVMNGDSAYFEFLLRRPIKMRPYGRI